MIVDLSQLEEIKKNSLPLFNLGLRPDKLGQVIFSASGYAWHMKTGTRQNIMRQDRELLVRVERRTKWDKLD